MIDVSTWLRDRRLSLVASTDLVHQVDLPRNGRPVLQAPLFTYCSNATNKSSWRVMVQSQTSVVIRGDTLEGQHSSNACYGHPIYIEESDN